MATRHRRDFLLDSGAITALAADTSLLKAYVRRAITTYDGSILVPVPVLTEVRSGSRNTDVRINRLFAAIGPNDTIYAPLTVATASRAGVLRAETRRASGRLVSTTDAQIVAIAEQRSRRHAVTIVTTDGEDIKALVDATRRPNIAVDVV